MSEEKRQVAVEFDGQKEKEYNPARDTFRRLLRHKGAVIGGILLIMLAGTAIFAPYIVGNPLATNPMAILEPPSAEHPLGTDFLGRDMLTRIVFGSRSSMSLGFVATGIALLVGVPLGLIAGYTGGRLDNIIMRFIDVLLAFPGILLAMLAVFALGPSLYNAMIAVGITRIPGHARVTRGAVISAKQNLYVEGAKALGASERVIMTRHLLPNVAAPNIVMATLGTGTAILAGASLSFLGLGAQAPMPEWGLMLSLGRGYLATALWLTLFPGLAIIVTVLAINLFGDGLRDVLDPRLKV